MYFSAAASSENDHGSMNLASNTAPVSTTTPSRVAPIHRTTGWRIRRRISLRVLPVLRSNQCRLRGSVTTPSWTIRFPERSIGSSSPRFSRQSLSKAASSWPIMTRASEPPTKVRLMPISILGMPIPFGLKQCFGYYALAAPRVNAISII